jgi:hypothetical protein
MFIECKFGKNKKWCIIQNMSESVQVETSEVSGPESKSRCESIAVTNLTEAVAKACINILEIYHCEPSNALPEKLHLATVEELVNLLDDIEQVTSGGQGLVFILDLDGVVTKGTLEELYNLHLNQELLGIYIRIRQKLPNALITIYTDRAKLHNWDQGAWINKSMSVVGTQDIIDLQDPSSNPHERLQLVLQEKRGAIAVGGTKRRSIQIITAFTYRVFLRTFLRNKGSDNGNRFGNFDRTMIAAIEALEEITLTNAPRIVCIIDDYHKLGNALGKHSKDGGRTIMHFAPKSILVPAELPKYAIPSHLAPILVRMFVQVMKIRRQLARERLQ